jgi:hypothetical protein
MAYRPYIWRKNNPEKRREQKRREKIRRALRDKGIFPSIGEEMNEEQKEIDRQISNNDFSCWEQFRKRPSHSGGTQIKIPIKSPEYIIWYRAKDNAKEYGRDFDISIEDILIPEECPYLGLKLDTYFDNNHSSNYYSIDRIDSSKGYVKDNIQIISLLANTMKNSATSEQLVTFAKNVLKIHNPES